MPSSKLISKTYAAARSASLGVTARTSAALGAGVVRVDEDGSGLHLDSDMFA
jgi:hypothetical protein